MTGSYRGVVTHELVLAIGSVVLATPSTAYDNWAGGQKVARNGGNIDTAKGGSYS